MLDRLDSGLFAPHLQQRFVIGEEGLTIDATLVEVSELKSQRLATGGGIAAQAFSIVFEGPETPALGQGIYPVHHDELGMIEIFLVPIGFNGKAMQYEAVFT